MPNLPSIITLTVFLSAVCLIFRFVKNMLLQIVMIMVLFAFTIAAISTLFHEF